MVAGRAITEKCNGVLPFLAFDNSCITASLLLVLFQDMMA